MDLFHTSPAEIKNITTGRFGEFLFFSSREYVMCAGNHVTYKLEVADDEIIAAGSIFFHEDAGKLEELVAELSDQLGVDADVAEALIEESKSVHDLDEIEAEDAADLSWEVQRFTAHAAKILGFRGVAVADEQGTAYMIDMQGRESEWSLV